MTVVIKKASDAAQLARELNGYVNSKRNLNNGKDRSPNPAVPGQLYKHPVNGLTLVFSTPGTTVTFAANLDMYEIVSEINTQVTSDVAHLSKTGPNGEMTLILYDDAAPVTLSHTGTANSYFGFSTTSSDPGLAQTVTLAEDIISIVVENLSRQYVAFIDG